MKRRAFSIMEMLFTLIIMGIITTIAIPTYQSFIETSDARVCETNLRALKTALDIYAMDHDTMPGALGAIPQEYIDKAYAQVMQRPDAWKTKLAYSILEWNERGLAYAAEIPNFLYALAKGNIRLITCPKAPNPPQLGPNNSIINSSYVMNPILAVGAVAGIGIASSRYRDPNITPTTTILIADSAPGRHINVFNFSADRQYSLNISREGTIAHTGSVSIW